MLALSNFCLSLSPSSPPISFFLPLHADGGAGGENAEGRCLAPSPLFFFFLSPDAPFFPPSNLTANDR